MDITRSLKGANTNRISIKVNDIEVAYAFDLYVAEELEERLRQYLRGVTSPPFVSDSLEAYWQSVKEEVNKIRRPFLEHRTDPDGEGRSLYLSNNLIYSTKSGTWYEEVYCVADKALDRIYSSSEDVKVGLDPYCARNVALETSGTTVYWTFQTEYTANIIRNMVRRIAVILGKLDERED